jgi:HSP20 family protein
MFRDRWSRLSPLDDESLGYPVDIHEEEGIVHVEAEMPGFSRDEIDVEIEDGVLRIAAERTPPKSRGTTYLDERRYTRIERSLTLPRGFDESKAKARLEDGVLHVEAPRTEASTGRRIDIG